MHNVVQLITKDQNLLNQVTSELPGLRPTHDKFCPDCNEFVAATATDCPKNHKNIRLLSPEQQMAATIDVMWRLS
jgi:hypothetical protein